jgi:hypothetical protein
VKKELYEVPPPQLVQKSPVWKSWHPSFTERGTSPFWSSTLILYDFAPMLAGHINLSTIPSETPGAGLEVGPPHDAVTLAGALGAVVTGGLTTQTLPSRWYPLLHVYSHLGPVDGEQVSTTVLSVGAINPELSPEHKVALPGVVPVQDGLVVVPAGVTVIILAPLPLKVETPFFTSVPSP